MEKLEFPKNFLWGAASSGPQTEGNRNKVNKSCWDQWYENDQQVFFDKIGPNKTCLTYENYESDVQLLYKMNINSFRTSIQWSRLIKNFATAEVDEDGFNFYLNYFKAIKSKNIVLSVALHHFDMPEDLLKIGGWKSTKVIEMFVLFAKKCFELFKDLVDYWFTFNEPICIVDSGYISGEYHQPLIKDFKTAMQVAFNLMLTNAKVIKTFRFMNLKSEIEILLNLTPGYVKDENSKDDMQALFYEHIITNKIFLDPSIKGEVSVELVEMLKSVDSLWKASEEDYKIIKENIIDILGVNYYAPVRIKSKEIKGKCENRGYWFDMYQDDTLRINKSKGWEIYAKGIYDIASWIKNDYGNIKWMVTENGMGVTDEHKFIDNNGMVNDDYRIEFMKEHLYWLYIAIAEDANCIGYHTWTFIDCWSWLNAFKNRYGLVRLDYNTQKRTVKKSGHWFTKVAKTNVIENKGSE